MAKKIVALMKLIDEIALEKSADALSSELRESRIVIDKLVGTLRLDTDADKFVEAQFPISDRYYDLNRRWLKEIIDRTIKLHGQQSKKRLAARRIARAMGKKK